MLSFRSYIRSWSLYQVNGESMEPALLDGDLVLVSKTLAAFPARGSLVVLRPPESDESGRGTQVKRLTGLPGDTVAFEDGSLLVNGEAVREPYLGGLPQTLGLETRRWTVGDGECFVLGDNRAHSTDSREYGPIALGAIQGVVKLRVWPMMRRWGRI